MIQAFCDKCQREKQKKSEEVVESKLKVVVHDAELQIVEEKFKVEVQGIQEKARDEDTSVEVANQVSDEPFEEPGLLTYECPIVVLVCDQPSYEKQVLDQDEIQPIKITTPARESVVFADIVDLVLEMRKVEDQVQTYSSV